LGVDGVVGGVVVWEGGVTAGGVEVEEAERTPSGCTYDRAR